MTIKYPIKIHRLDESGRVTYKAATTLERVQQNVLGVQDQLEWMETDYRLTIAAARAILEDARYRVRKDPRGYWHFAWILDGFLQRLERQGYYLPHAYLTFARDLSLSPSSLKKVLLFYRRFSDPSLINPAITWQRYRDNKVIA